MAATTLPASTPRTDTPPRLKRMGAALASWVSQGTKVASAARHRLRRPALVIGGLGFFDAAAYQGPLWVGLAMTGLSFWIYEALTGDDEPGGKR